jgi:hypothetical protein
VEADDGAVTAGFHQFNFLILVKFIINSLHSSQSTAGVFVGEHNNALDIPQFFPGGGLEAHFKSDIFILRDDLGILEHSGDHITGHPVIDLHQKFLGIGEVLNLRSQTGEESVNFSREILLKILDDGPGIQATMMLLHFSIRLRWSYCLGGAYRMAGRCWRQRGHDREDKA